MCTILLYTGNQRSKELLRIHFDNLVNAIIPLTLIIYSVLYINKLIPLKTRNNIQGITYLDDYRKASKLVYNCMLQTHCDPDRCLHDICRVLKNP